MPSSAIETIAKLGVSPTLRTFAFGVLADGTRPRLYSIADLSVLYGALRDVEEIYVRVGEIGTLGDLDLPNLRSLELATCAQRPSVLSSIVKAHARLERLAIDGGDWDSDKLESYDELAPLFEADWPRLTHLGLRHMEIADAIVRELPSRVLRNVRVLDLSGGLLGDRGGEAILARAADFAHLDTLDLDDHRMSPAVAAKVHQVCQRVIGRPRHQDDDCIDTGEVEEGWDWKLAVPRRGA